MIVDFKCSRYYPISDINNQRKSLILILKEINSRTKGIKKERDDDRIIDNIPWMKIMEVFLPLPQWRRAELLHVYCNKVLEIYKVRNIYFWGFRAFRALINRWLKIRFYLRRIWKHALIKHLLIMIHLKAWESFCWKSSLMTKTKRWPKLFIIFWRKVGIYSDNYT